VTIGGPAGHALLLRDFANTVDVEEGSDALADPAALTAWLRDHRLIPDRAADVAGAGGADGHGSGPAAAGGGGTGAGGGGGGTKGSGGADDGAGQSDLDIAIALRDGLRAAMREHHNHPGDGLPRTVPALGEAAADLPLRVADLAGRPALVPAQGGVRGGLAWLAAAMVASTADGSWERLKICADDTCQWAFLDSSKNRSKHWCSMQECGNRSKTRAYRARRGGGASGA
jgi:predicted RNA-binding Zn ribbon-like protein